MKPYYDEGGITIYHGDCREVLPTLEPVDLVLTDPPYGEVNRESSGLRVFDKGAADVVTFMVEELATSLAALCRSVYLFCGIEQVSGYRRALVAAGLSTRLAIWEKSNPSPMNGQYLWLSSIEACVFGRKSGAPFNEHCASPVWRGPIARPQVHPTEKPLWLMHRLIGASSIHGGSVLDPFMGSGTTLRAAKDMGRRCIGIELEERYCEIAARRLAQEVLF